MEKNKNKLDEFNDVVEFFQRAEIDESEEDAEITERREKRAEERRTSQIKRRSLVRHLIIGCVIIVALIAIAALINVSVKETSANHGNMYSTSNGGQSAASSRGEYAQMSVIRSDLRTAAPNLMPDNQALKLLSDRRSSTDLAIRHKKENIAAIDPDKPMVAFTFDDGPYSPVTERILDVMEKYNSRCTFFVVGNRVWKYSDSMRRAISLGCEIGSHSYDHSTLTKLSDEDIFYQMNEADYQISYYAGQISDVMRPPGGSHDSRVDALVGKPLIMWSLDTKDWKTRDAVMTTDAVLNNVSDGDIILMHDLYPASAEAIETIVPTLIEKGYQIVTVHEMAQAKGITMKNGSTYFSFKY